MRYPDGGGLTAAEWARREWVQLAAREPQGHMEESDPRAHGGAECMSVHAVAGLIKFFSPVSRAGLSTCPGRDLPGQLHGLLRTSLPGKTVSGQDPASLDRLDLFQRGQRATVIVVHV